MAHVNSIGAAHHRITEDILVLTAGPGTGAGLMYLCDPKRGRLRRGRPIAELSRFIRRDENRMAKRTSMGHIVSRPHEIRVQAKDGIVTLEGLVTHAEKRRFREEVRTIPGVALPGRTGAPGTRPAAGGEAESAL